MNTLDKWIIGEVSSKKDIKYKYFYLEWIDTKSPKMICWKDILPPDCNISKEIKLRDGPTIVVCGKITKQIPDKEPFYDLSEIAKLDNYREFTNKELLKSHLQKSVRRHETTKAVLSAFHLMRLDFQSFARRFPIIAIEDSSLHIGINVLIWFMTLGPSKYLSIVHIRYFLGLVVNICESKHYDRPRVDEGLPQKIPIFKVIPFWENCDKLNCQIKRDLLLGILLRRAYGGMKGDMGMLAATCQKWLDKSVREDMTSKCRMVKIRNYLALEDFIIASVDFHCFPSILFKIKNKHPQFNVGQIKKAIWQMSSSINYRLKNKVTDSELKIFYGQIKETYIRIARDLLFKCH